MPRPQKVAPFVTHPFDTAIATARRISDTEKISALRDAKFEFDAKMRDLQASFEDQASKLSEIYLARVTEIHQR